MSKNKLSARTLSMLTAAVLFAVAPGVASAQQSAYEDLNACTKGEQIKGAALGALTGFGTAFLFGKKDAKTALAGAVVGGAAGWGIAAYAAIDTCFKLNPSWKPESKIERDPGKSYAQVVKENNYKSKDGIKLVAMTDQDVVVATAGGTSEVRNTFDLMTPDGAEAPVVIERKLFAIANGQENPVKFDGFTTEKRTIEAGRFTDFAKLPIPPDAKAGSEYRVEVSVAASGNRPVVISRSVKVG